MSGVRVLLGACKGAFVLTSAAMRKQREIAAPHFPGREIFDLKRSPGDPERLYASQYRALFGQLIERSNDGGKTCGPVGGKFQYESLGIEPANQMAPVSMGNPRNKDFWAPVLSKNAPLQDRAHICAFFNRPDEGHRVLLPFVEEGLELGQKSLHKN